jgi:phosphocarrier protein HPr
MATRTVTIASSVGLHARPAALFVQLAGESGLDIEIGRPGEDAVDATSILGRHGPGRQARRGGRAHRRG